MVGSLPGHGNGEDIVQSEEKFLILAEETAATSPGRVLRDAERPAVNVKGTKELEDLKAVKRENESFPGRLNEYKGSFETIDMKLAEGQLKSLALLRDFKGKQQECNILSIENDLIHKSTSGSSVKHLLNVKAG